MSSVLTKHDDIPQAVPVWGCDCIPLMLKSIIKICLVSTMFYIHTCGEYQQATYVMLVPRCHDWINGFVSHLERKTDDGLTVVRYAP